MNNHNIKIIMAFSMPGNENVSLVLCKPYPNDSTYITMIYDKIKNEYIKARVCKDMASAIMNFYDRKKQMVFQKTF